MSDYDYDAVAELAARMTEKYRRGEEPGLVDRLAWDGLTGVERDEFMGLPTSRSPTGWRSWRRCKRTTGS